MRRLLAFAGTAAALAAGAAPASASQVSENTQVRVLLLGPKASEGIQTVVSEVAHNGSASGYYAVHDSSSTMTIGFGTECVLDPSMTPPAGKPPGQYTANCDATGVDSIQATLGNAADVLAVTARLKLVVLSHGGNDTIIGGPLDDQMSGAPATTSSPGARATTS